MSAVWWTVLLVGVGVLVGGDEDVLLALVDHLGQASGVHLSTLAS